MDRETRLRGQNALTANGRFGEMAAVTPQKMQCNFGSLYPAASVVEPPPRQAAGTLCVSSESAGRESSTFRERVQPDNVVEIKIEIKNE